MLRHGIIKMVIKMEKEKEWLDLKLCDWGKSQINDRYELKRARDLMKSFYITILLPLYVPVQNNKNWHFSVPDKELTCRIFYQDLVRYHKKENSVSSIKDLLYQVSKYNVLMTTEKIDQMVDLIEKKKQEKEDVFGVLR